MPFIPHTEEDVSAMLGAIGAASIEDLFDEIPPALKTGKLKDVPDGLPEMAVTRLMQERASADGFWSSFIGAGVYEHHIPAAIWQITTRGEFYSAYTPYQAEASQGTLQLIYEYQTMMTRLTGLDVSNASLYDGASALAEAVLMAVRSHKTSRRVLVPKSVHPIYRRVVQRRPMVGRHEPVVRHHRGAVVLCGELDRRLQRHLLLTRFRRSLIGVAAPEARLALGELLLQLARIEQHQAGQFDRARGGEDGSLEAARHDVRNQAAVVEVGVGEQDGVQLGRVVGERDAVADCLVGAALEHAAIDQDPGPAGGQQELRAGDRGRRAQELELHHRG